MSGLRETADRIARMGRLPLPAADRKLACERAADRLVERDSRPIGPPESWDAFLRRIGVIGD